MDSESKVASASLRSPPNRLSELWRVIKLNNGHIVCVGCPAEAKNVPTPSELDNSCALRRGCGRANGMLTNKYGAHFVGHRSEMAELFFSLTGSLSQDFILLQSLQISSMCARCATRIVLHPNLCPHTIHAVQSTLDHYPPEVMKRTTGTMLSQLHLVA